MGLTGRLRLRGETGDCQVGAIFHRRGGEAAKNISPAFKEAYPDILWRAIAGIRDKIVHEYFRSNTRRIWDVVADDIDGLEEALTRPGPLSI